MSMRYSTESPPPLLILLRISLSASVSGWDKRRDRLNRSGVRKFKSGIGVSLAQTGAAGGTLRQGALVRP